MATLEQRIHTSWGRDLALWLGILGPPALLGVHQQAVYALVPRLCIHESTAVWMHATTAACLSGVIACAFCAWFGSHHHGEPISAEDTSHRARPRFMGTIGLMSSTLFGLVIVAQLIAMFFFDPCWN